MKKFTEELNEPKGWTKQNILKISQNVRNPSGNVPKYSVYLRQPSLIFGNLRKSSGYLVIFEILRVIFENLR